ncbi:hypothetical protein KOM00_00005 [Geomonas sp. Red69]|uniref:VPA1269 family protein n=1 Tax=Geomonas diazotrophica TaxID=2843197 RepID=UPI001C10C100|nr:VPA1269 family protein [Geomonas diazotrophica]MBU5635112.1 hypothetical protein [Geomonas diazotrophica]
MFGEAQIVEINGVRVNIGTMSAFCNGIDAEIADVLQKLDVVSNTKDHDALIGRLSVFKSLGVLLPSSFMLELGRKRNNYKAPSFECVTDIPGVEPIWLNMKEHWPKTTRINLIQSFFARIIISLYYCMEISDFKNMTPELFHSAIRPWKDDLGFWRKELLATDTQTSTLNKVADSFNRLQQTTAYKAATKQPRTRNDGISAGANFLLSHPPKGTEKWALYFNEWLHGQQLSNTRLQKTSFANLLKWLILYPIDIISTPEQFMLATKTDPSFVDFMKGKKQEFAKEPAKIVLTMLKFTEWIRANYLTDTSEDGAVILGQPLILPKEMSVLDGAWVNHGLTETQSRPLPTAWRIKLREIITRDDFEFPKSIDDQYFLWLNPETGILEKKWVPVLSYAFLSMLELPVRMIQVMMLDSGEGDIKRYNHQLKCWEPNDHSCACHWTKDPAIKVNNKGVLKAMGTPVRPLVGFYINTNKTSGNTERYGEYAGYDIPWENEQVIALFSELRAWQGVYNPVDAPLPFSAVAEPVFGYRATERVLREVPDRFYLFRSPTSPGSRQHPPTYRQRYDFWVELMEKLEAELREEGEDVQIIIKRKPDGRPQTPFYNIHGLRVATLTAFAEAGVPIEVLSKLVAGHSTIIMTLYYMKFNEAAISSLLTEKSLVVAENAESELRRCLENKAWEDAKRLAVYNDENTFRSTIEEQMYPSWHNVGFGFCPNAGTRCYEGGPEIGHKKEKKNQKFGPVPGGNKNCVRCRLGV